MINRVVLVGRLTADPILKYTPTGVPVTNFNLAVNRPFSNQQGEREADFISIVVWRKAAENIATFVKKGSLVGIDGRLQTRSYDNNEGKRTYITEVVADSVQFLEPKGGRGSTGGNQDNQSSNQSNRNSFPDSPFDMGDPFRNDSIPSDFADDLPF
jgi:single-strand DNA-binding protein